MAAMAILVSASAAAAAPGDAGLKTNCAAYDDYALRAQRGTVLEYANGKLDKAATEQVEQIRSRLRALSPANIVVHLHGGLVDRCQGYGTAVRLGPLYRTAGVFPIFPIYHVGFWESLHYGRAGFTAYPVEDPRSAAVIPRIIRINRETQQRVQLGRDHAGEGTTRREERLRYAAFVNGGLWTGGRVWAYMKRVVDESMHTDSADVGPFPTLGPAAREDDPAGLTIMRVLEERIAENPQTRITLVGHSTGAIWITKFLRAWYREHRTDKKRFSVIFIAPAVRYDDFARLLPREPRAGESVESAAIDLVANFRTFAMRDEYEINVNEIGTFFAKNIYAPSLLYGVSSIFEDHPDTPILGMQRFQCRDGLEGHLTLQDYSPDDNRPNAAQAARDSAVVHRVDSVLHDLFATPFAYSPALGARVPETFRTGSVTHGGFPDDPATIQSVTALSASRQSWPALDKNQWRTIEDCGVDPMTLLDPDDPVR